MTSLRPTVIQTGIRQKSLTKHCRLGRATNLVFVLATGVTLNIAVGSDAFAQDRSWTGGTANWNTVDNNWDAGGGPNTAPWADGNAATFGTANDAATVDSGPVSATGITITADGVSLSSATAADTLTVTGSIDVQNAAESATFSAGTTGAITTNGAGTLSFTGTGATGISNTGAGTLNFNTTATANASNSGAGTLNINGALTGTLTQSGTGTTNVGTGGSVSLTSSVSDGEIAVTGGALTGETTITGGATLDIDSGSVGTVVINDGTFEAGGGTIGAVTLTQGTLSVDGANLSAQNFTNIDANDVVSLSNGSIGNLTVNGGTLTVTNGTAGTLTNTSGTNTTISGGSVGNTTVTDGTVDLTLTGQINGTLDVNGGTITINETANAADNEVTGLTTVTNGVLTVTQGDLAAVTVNETTADAATDFTLTAGTIDSLALQAGQAAIAGGTVEGNSTASGGALSITNGVIDGTLAISGADVTINETADAADEITGTTTITGGSLTITEGDVATVTVNDAAADANAADLTLTSGTIATLNVQAGEATIAGGTVEGELDMTGGAVTMSNGTVSGLTDVNSGTFNFNGGTLGNVENAATFAITESETVGGTFTNQTGGTIDANSATAAATLTVTGTGAAAANPTFTNAGNIRTNGTDALTIDSDRILLQAGTTFQEGVAAADNDLDGNVILDGAITNQADLDVTGAMSLTGALRNEGTLDVSAAITGGGQTVTNIIDSGSAGQLNFDAGGSLAGAGAISNQAGADITIDGGTVDTSDQATVAGASLTNNGAGSTVTVNGVLTASTVTNEVGGQIIVDGQSATQSGQVGGNIVNSADLDLQTADINGTLTNNDAAAGGGGGTRGDIDVTNGISTVSGKVINAADLAVADAELEVEGTNTVTNQDGGQILLTGAGRLDATTVTNESDGASAAGTGAGIDVSGTAVIEGNLVNQVNAQAVINTTTNITGVDGTVTNNGGDLDLQGGSITSLDNNNGTSGGATVRGDVDITGAFTIDAASTNVGDFNITNGTTTLTAGTFTNEDGGVATIAAGASLSGDSATGQFINQSDGDGATIGTSGLVLGGTISSWVDNQAGATIEVTGTAGAIQGDNNGATAGGFGLVNAGSLNFDVNETLTVTNGVTSSGSILSRGAAATLTGALTQTGGDLSFTSADSALTVSGDLTQTGGTIELNDNAATTNSLSVGGNAVLNGTVNMDVDISNGSTSADTIAVTGTLSGAVNLAFTTTGTPGDLGAGLTLMTASDTSGLSFGTITGLPATAAFDYSVSQTGTAVVLNSTVSTGIGGLAASVGLTETIVGAIINRPTSPFVADLATDPGDKPCGGGGWVRATGGAAEATGGFTSNNTKLNAPVDLNYAGLQFGGDMACFGGQANGWDLAYGAIGGFNTGDTTSLDINGNAGTTTTDFTQTYLGGYMTAARGRLFADIQLRFEQTDFTTNNTALSLSDTKYSNKSQTLSGAVGYSWPIGDTPGLNFVGSGGIALTKSSTDSIDLGGGDFLQLADHTTKLGFVSGTVARSVPLPDEISLISYFGTATLYNDFSGERNATLNSGGNLTEVTLDSLGAYGEVSAGVNYLRLLEPGQAGNARQLNASVRMDLRSGESVDSWGLTAQARIQF